MQTIFKTSFEGGFEDYEGISELTVPKGWVPAWLELPEDEKAKNPGILWRPEYDLKTSQETEPKVHSGSFAANFFNVFATHDACLYRRFKVEKGKGVRVRVWGMSISYDDDGNKRGAHGMRVGIDPVGGMNHNALQVAYGKFYSVYQERYEKGKWVELSAEAIAEADEITVFLHSRVDFKVQISASHWDDLVLEMGEPEEVKPRDLREIEIKNLTMRQLHDYIQYMIEKEQNN